MKKKLVLVLKGIICLLTIILIIVALIQSDKIQKQEKKIAVYKKEIEGLKRSVDDNMTALINRNNELYICQMEKDEWKELFYAEIDFYPNEGYLYGRNEVIPHDE